VEEEEEEEVEQEELMEKSISATVFIGNIFKWYLSLSIYHTTVK